VWLRGWYAAVVVLSRRDHLQTGGRGIIMTSARRPSSSGRDGDDDDNDNVDDLYSRYITSWRPDVNESRSSVKIAGVPKVSRIVLH